VKKLITVALAAVMGLGLVSCSSDADVASQNISKDADNFKVLRRIVAVNGFTDKYLLSVEGWCNITDQKTQLEIVCKLPDGYKKHFVGLSDNTTYFVEQLESAHVSVNHYKVVFKPSVIIPDVEAR
jgi:putative hemolysin